MTRRAANPDGPDGGLVVDKPAGITSHDIVAMARRALNQSRIGHTGTLDPLATGVLPLLVGRATRLAQFLGADRKTYEATVRFGFATSTYDAQGTPVGAISDAPVDPAHVEAALITFRGDIRQVPPAVSAKHVGGKRAYELARAEVAVALEPVDVTVHELELLGCEGSETRLRVTASAGFYVRSLAHDLGQILGCGAHLTSLRRTRSGSFTLDGAVSAEVLATSPEAVRALLRPMAALLPDLPLATVAPDGLGRLKHGRELAPAHLAGPVPTTTRHCRLVDPDGILMAVGENRGGFLHPVVVLM
jgi:tRNA pseudouridine55 synthase